MISVLLATALVSAAEMRAVYEEVKTPYKYGVILEPEKGLMLDNPNVFRHGDSWYMMYIVFDKKGYETWLAKSSDLLHWKPLGQILLRGEAGAWDCAQADGGPSLMDMRWEGPNTLGTHEGKYWMTYIGGAKTGYETDPLAIGVATTDSPSAAKLWTRVGNRPVLAPSDKDARWFEDITLFKSFVATDEARTLGGRYVMYYNAKTGAAAGRRVPWLESIGLAISDDMRTWKRLTREPVVCNQDAPEASAITGDPMIRKIGDKWVMFYFGFMWGPFKKHAGDNFAVSRDLVHWVEWTGEPLVAPSEPWDSQHAHKPWVIKHEGVVYHYYCAVGNRGRVLACATSKDMRTRRQDERAAVAHARTPKISVFSHFLTDISQARGVSLEKAADLVFDLGVRGFDCNVFEPRLPQLAATKLKPINLYYLAKWQDEASATAENARALDAAAKYGVPRIMTIPPHFTEGGDQEAEFVRITAHLKTFVAAAKARGITITVEDFGGVKNACSHVKYLKRMLDEIPDLRFALDSGNLYWAGRGEDILELMASAQGRIAHVHLKDQTREDNRKYETLGRGAVPNERIVKTTWAEGYDGWYTLENAVGDTYVDTVRQVAVLKAWLADVSPDK